MGRGCAGAGVGGEAHGPRTVVQAGSIKSPVPRDEMAWSSTQERKVFAISPQKALSTHPYPIYISRAEPWRSPSSVDNTPLSVQLEPSAPPVL